jgi:hypothetical protein
MWLVTLGLTIGALGVFAFAAGRWRVPRQDDHGSMSRQWLAEHRASDHA